LPLAFFLFVRYYIFMGTKKYLLFVYGTLKSNHKANYLLNSCQFLGLAKTCPEYSLYSLGNYPALIEDPEGMSITGEIYEINDYVKEDLDVYEGVKYGLYEFAEVKIEKPDLSPDKIYTYLFLGNLENANKIPSWP